MINLNPNKKKLIFGLVAVVISTILIVGSIITRKEKVVPTSTPVPTAKPFAAPQTSKLYVDGVEMNNYYQNAIITGKDGYALFEKTSKYKIAYIPVDKSFLISIIDNPFETVRKEAEQAFLQQLGISQENACRLKVNVATNIRIDPSHAGKNYKLSFCE